RSHSARCPRAESCCDGWRPYQDVSSWIKPPPSSVNAGANDCVQLNLPQHPSCIKNPQNVVFYFSIVLTIEVQTIWNACRQAILKNVKD
ncbi:hypothetical protein, partial [Enterobacter hormaechei]|uniref:hypothetical protein n=1 Tax=Enterobacter hormaechei TaxID=158836 RepID=UPI0022F10FB5